MLELFLKYPVPSTPTFLTIVPLAVMLTRMDFTNKPMRVILIYLSLKLINDLYAFYIISNGEESLHIANAWIIVSFFLVAILFLFTYTYKVYTHTLLIASVIFIGVFVFDISRDGIYLTFRYTGLAQCIFIMLMVLMYFHQLIRRPVVPDLLRDGLFWIASAMLMFYSSMLFLVPLGHYIDRHGTPSEMYIFTLLPYILEIFYLLLITVGILRNRL